MINGECKDSATVSDESVLIFHSADQLGYKDSSLSMLTSSTGIKFFQSNKDSRAGAMRTIFYETKRYKLGPISKASFKKDPHAQDKETKMPLMFHVR